MFYKKIMASYLQIENLTKSYGDRILFQDITFGVNEGDKIGIIAKNGTGKSTLLQIIAGKESADTGNITFRNDLRIGYLEQMPTLSENATIIGACLNENSTIANAIDDYQQALANGDSELIAHTMQQMDSVGAWDYEDKLRQILTQLNIKDINAHVSTLSGGQRKRVAIARIILENPQLIILDEPTAGQDYRVYTEIMTFLEDLNKNYGITILFITHDMHLAIEYTDRALVFSDGKCISSDNVFKVLSNEEVIEKANLKQTSLYTLASRLGLNAQEFIRHFIETERRGRA